MARRMNEPSFQFGFEEKWYTVQGAGTMYRLGTKDDRATMRAEYTRMRDVAQKRIKRLQEKFPDSEAAKNYYDTGKKDKKGNPIYAPGFQKLKDIDPKDFPKAFAELAKFVRAKASTVSGQKSIKQKTIAAWQKQGIDLNPKNYDMSMKILKEMRRQKIVYGSDDVTEAANYLSKLPKRQQNKWMKHLSTLMDNIDRLTEIPEAAGYSFEQAMNIINEGG